MFDFIIYVDDTTLSTIIEIVVKTANRPSYKSYH